MNLRDFLQAFRRRLLIVVTALAVGVLAGWVLAPGESRRDTTFQATHTLIFEASQTQQQTAKIEQIALLATSGNVPSRVADRLKLDRGQVRSSVSAFADIKVSTISVTGRSLDSAQAVALADVTAQELMAELLERDQAAYEAERNRLTAEAESARKRFGASKTPAEQSAARGPMEAADRGLSQFNAAGPPKPKLRTLEAATATVVDVPGVKVPSSKPALALLLGIVGLLVGVAGAFALARLDSRIRSKRTAEEAFGAPVVAEVPPLRKSPEGQLLTRTQPSSAFVEAYRGLRTYVALWSPPKAAFDDGHRVIVVTSPAPGEGKTTTVAHLAAMLAEIGRSVVVVSADLRRPRLHRYFDRSGEPGLVDVLAAVPGSPTFDDLDLSTSVRGVRLVPSGRPIENPAPLLEHFGQLLRAARGLAEFVLVDSPPLLLANDAVDLARHADGVLLVARAGETTIGAAEQSAQLLKRLEIPVVGTVLIGSESAPGASRYYSARYYHEPERTSRLRRSVAVGDRRPAAETTPVADEEASSEALSTELAWSENGIAETIPDADGEASSKALSTEPAWAVNGHAEAMTTAVSAWSMNGHGSQASSTEPASDADGA